MMSARKTFLCLLIALSCSVAGMAQPNLQFNLMQEDFDIDLPNAVYALNVNYDNIDLGKQVFHLFLPDTMGNYPLVVFIHGGGFTGGNPGVVVNGPQQVANVEYFLANGFAYASIGYRLINSNGPDTEGVIKSLNDSKRALQYIRYYADELYINPEKIALTGTSAGSGTSLWLATRPDMADPDAADPVLKESTRVCAVGAGGSQSTYDIYKWETEIFQDFDGQGTNYTLDSMAALLTFDRLSNFYGGLDSINQVVNDPALIQYREDVDILFHMSSDDPPIYINSRSGAVHPSDDLFHHSFHGRALNDAALAAGIPEVKAFIPALSINTTGDETMDDFLIRQLNGCSQATSVVQNEVLIDLAIYPNPAQDQITVSLASEQITDVEVYALTGQLMRQNRGIFANTVDLSIGGLPAGIYVVRVSNERGAQAVKKLFIE